MATRKRQDYGNDCAALIRLVGAVTRDAFMSQDQKWVLDVTTHLQEANRLLRERDVKFYAASPETVVPLPTQRRVAAKRR